jgi:hypothetical protein
MGDCLVSHPGSNQGRRSLQPSEQHAGKPPGQAAVEWVKTGVYSRKSASRTPAGAVPTGISVGVSRQPVANTRHPRAGNMISTGLYTTLFCENIPII